VSAFAIRFHRGGVYLPGLKLWLDPREPQAGADRVFISHAHSDHTGLHREVILSKPTSKLMHARIEGAWQEHVLPFGETMEFAEPDNPFQITLLPAGHIFGSAMALIEAEGKSLLYTGDFKLRPGLSAEPCTPRAADILIMETTYGRPEYRFPETNEVLRGITRFCREALDNEETPVLLGYSLGKSQELLCGLSEAGLPIALHGAVHRLTKIYEQFGQKFPAHEKYESSSARGKVLVCPPQVVNTAMLRNLGPIRLAVLTGWAVDANCRYRYQTHAAFPLSDHADFADLLAMVRTVAPKQVYTLHGFAADFAQTLREQGFQAQALSEDEQLTLPLALSTARPAARAEGSAPAVRNAPHPESSLVHYGESAPGTAPERLTESTLPPTPAANGFHQFALVCSQIGSTAKKLEKVRILSDYLKGQGESEIRLVSTWFTGHPFPPIEGKVLQLGWALIRDALCAVAHWDQNDFGQCYLKHSDLGETAFEILHSNAPPQSRLGIRDVEKVFLELHAARGPLNKQPLLSRILRHSTPLEGKYLVKILTGDLRIGLKEGLVEESIGQAFEVPLDQVKNTHLLLGSIGETAALARTGQLASASLVPFRPIKFMLASPEADAAAIWKRVQEWAAHSLSRAEAPLPLEPLPAQLAVWLEDKYDGIRCQLHKVGDRVALYSRDLREITTTFLEVADSLRPTPADFVLDGELLAMRGDVSLPFAELQKRLGRREGDLFLGQQIPVRFLAFDLLWLNGESTLTRPLRARRAALEQIPFPSAIRLAQVVRAYSPADIERTFQEARARLNEGLMVKEAESIYTPGRRGLSWLKLKKAYATLDCVVVGAEYGHGKRKAVLSDYTFAVRDEKTGEFKVIGKAYTGLTDAEIAQLTRHFLSKSIRQHGRSIEVEPDTVLEIAFDAVQRSDRHASGLALRFPRINRIRGDKSPADIDTLETARKLAKE
jgi:DNA ligase-1